MAKKRVHEIAKEKGIPSKEVIAKLQAAGLNVKAAASSVDEADIELAFSGGKKAPAEDGRGKRQSGTARPGNGKAAASAPQRAPG
ncbi:MAG: translation initiation factor IF-2 N-terminal domain-containing protein, partial [Actinomycetota bacterium]|nr:translation initiation factor IF-2 N-terminal domain-containing protein [Actinomycetota bacterium]